MHPSRKLTYLASGHCSARLPGESDGKLMCAGARRRNGKDGLHNYTELWLQLVRMIQIQIESKAAARFRLASAWLFRTSR